MNFIKIKDLKTYCALEQFSLITFYSFTHGKVKAHVISKKCKWYETNNNKGIARREGTGIIKMKHCSVVGLHIGYHSYLL